MNVQPLTHAEKNTYRQLHTRVGRREQQRFIVEGPHAVEQLLHGSLDVQCLIVRSDAIDSSLDIAERFSFNGIPVLSASVREINQLCDAQTPQDLVAVVSIPVPHVPGNRLLVLDKISDPGNLGTMIRTAAWFGFTDVICSSGCVDAFNTKVVRAAVGALSMVNIIQDADLANMLPTLGISTIVGTTLTGGSTPESVVLQDPLALIIGSEAHGIEEPLLQLCTHHVHIPGTGSVESLNASIAAGILCYEFRRRV